MRYDNFVAAVFCTVRDMEVMAAAPDPDQMVAFISRHVRVGKVYLETYRTGHQVDREQVVRLKEVFARHGIETAGAITPNFVAGWDFRPSCYGRPEHRKELERIMRFTAELFDEVILDDFFFTNCRCEACIAAKGGRSWDQFRTELLAEVSRDAVVGPAKQVNPKVRVVIKYPNWYEDYQATGYNLADQPKLFDGIYTGTETRDPAHSQQTLQRYLSYFLVRYLENVKPGKNGGGWFDTFDCLYNLGSYAEQCWLTLFAKAREVTLFSAGLLHRDAICAPVAGHAMEAADAFLGQLGAPIGIACYKPYHSSGEPYLHGYLGMLGLPLEPFPEFPAGHGLVLLTESAAKDPAILDRIKGQLAAGKEVVITSGLLGALQDLGFGDLAPIRLTGRKVAVRRFAAPFFECSFGNYWDVAAPAGPIEIPELAFPTNDALPLVAAFGENRAYPFILQIRYGAGFLYILTVPEDFGALYRLPAPVLDLVRKTLGKRIPVRLEGPAQVGLFAYDDGAFIVESFLPINSDVKVVVQGKGIEGMGIELVDLVSREKLRGQEVDGQTEFAFKLRPTSFRVLRPQARTLDP